MKKKIPVILTIIFIIAGSISLNIKIVNASPNTEIKPVNETKTINASKDNGVLDKGITAISHIDGYILGISNKSINAADIKFNVKFKDLTAGEIRGNDCQWIFNDPKIAVYKNGIINILKKGRTQAKVSRGGVSTTIMLFVKENSNDQYVLYDENFDNLADGVMPKDWKKIQGTNSRKSGVKKGAFEIDACTSGDNPTRVLLPDYVGKFGNYTIQVDVNNLKANDEARWNSIMYRIVNNNYPYYQMAVRKNANTANGVEFAEMTHSASWNIIKKSSFSEPTNNGKMYHYTIKVYKNRVQQFINGKLLVDTDLAGSYLKGRVGFQTNGSIMRLDNIKISLLETPLPKLAKPEDKYARVAETNTSIALAPTVVSEIAGPDEINSIVSKGLAATAIININKYLEVTVKGTTDIIGTVDDFYKKMESRVIPAFRVSDTDTVDALTAYLNKHGIEDVFVVSDKPELVKRARQNCPIIRGVIEFDNVNGNITTEELMNILQTTNSNLSKITVLPADAASKPNVQYLQQRLITVWAKDNASDDLSETRLITFHRLITAGVNGIITTTPLEAKQALETYNHNITIVRQPFVIGHRGVPDIAPENTLEGSMLAFQMGADMVENDIYPTKTGKDGKRHLVVMHDATIDHTTNGTGNIADMTLEEISKYYVNKQFPITYPSAKIPMLAQYLEKFNSKDKVVFVELKSADPVTVDLCASLIKEMGVEDNVATISFNSDHIKRMSKQMPGMSQGFLCSGIANDLDVYGSLRNALMHIQPLNTTFNPSYINLEKKFIEASKHRGMTIWPWNYTDKATIIKYFKMGICGMTTNSTHTFSDWVINLTPTQSAISMKKGESISMKANAETYKGDIAEIEPEVVVLSGKDNILADRNIITSKNSGDSYITLRYTAKLSENEGDSYDIYTQPIKVQVE